jgi:OOP family OmpA-OmpF porin
MNRLPILILLLFAYKLSAQNLIANGTFEEINTCTEFNQECAPEAWRTVSTFLPQFLSDHINKNSVDKFVGISVFNPNSANVRNYLQSQLICPMIKGKKYQFSFRIKPDKIILESFGVHFSDTLIFVEKEKLLKIKPSIDISSKYAALSKKNRKNWVKIDLEYTATGKEKYIIIGNFQADNEQPKIYISDLKPYTTYYYYIDDVVLYTADTLCWCKDSEVRKQFIYDQNDRHSYRRLPQTIGFPLDSNVEITTIETNDTIRLGDLSFEFNSSELGSEGISNLKTYFQNINSEKIESIDINGHTDSIGLKEYNLELSKKRAQAVKVVLDDLGLSELIREVEGYGDQKPISTNETEKGRKSNRRVEIIIRFNQ